MPKLEGDMYCIYCSRSVDQVKHKGTPDAFETFCVVMHGRNDNSGTLILLLRLHAVHPSAYNYRYVLPLRAWKYLYMMYRNLTSIQAKRSVAQSFSELCLLFYFHWISSLAWTFLCIEFLNLATTGSMHTTQSLSGNDSLYIWLVTPLHKSKYVYRVSEIKRSIAYGLSSNG